jgi:cytochrome oxidase Cu insertion factor (SCO1/SenC/PrrC family)
MSARTVLVIIAGLVIGTAAALAIFPQARQALLPASGPVTSGKALVGGPFTLTDGSGKRVTDKDYRGRYMLVFFGYTSCPDICPAGLQLISAALENLGPKADRITPIFISVDPARDTPEKLADYVKNFSPRLVGLTGTPEEVAAVAKAYKVYYKKKPNPSSPDDYAMDHTGIIYLMDPNGEFVTHFTPTTPVDDLTAKLDKIL